jgi:hypothetical protein
MKASQHIGHVEGRMKGDRQRRYYEVDYDGNAEFVLFEKLNLSETLILSPAYLCLK